MSVFSDLGLYFWRLLPGNPMVVRVVAAGGKRVRHMWARFIYLAALFVVMLLWSGAFFSANTSLADLAKNSTQIFMAVSLVQLALMSFIAPVFTAGAITQERDSNTFDILLTTPLSNAQIVLGSLFSRLFFVLAMLLAGLPIFCITMLYGGVTTAEVFQSLGLAASTALLTGALAITISMLKIGTRRTIFAFFLGIAIYLLGVFAVGWHSASAVAEAPPSTSTSQFFMGQRMSWLTPIHPFLSLFVVTGLLPAPKAADVYHYGWPWRWMLANPQYAYMLLTTLASALLVAVSLLFVRRGAKEGEATWLNRLMGIFKQRNNGERSHKPRRVWRNPIAWREAVTRGSAAGRSLLRWVFIIGGLALGVVLLIVFQNDGLGVRSAASKFLVPEMREWLTVLIWIEMAIILLVVTNTAAGTLTREKESQTVEILLTTPLTSRYIIGGMLQGLVRFAVPLVAVPTGTLLVFLIADFFRGEKVPPVLTPEVILLAPLLMVSFCAMAAMIGLQFSLTSKKTVQAVMISTSIVLGACGLLWLCGSAIAQQSAEVGAVVLPFTPFPALQALINIDSLHGSSNPSVAAQTQVRIIRFITSLISALVYMGITFSLYKNMVRGFDMIVRRQSA